MTADASPNQRRPRPSLSSHHVPALDGVRGIAILAVLLCHITTGPVAHFWSLLGQWGWMGVDLFFVLSGYLITGVLMDARGSDVYYSSFYIRRALRLFPALGVFLVVLLYVLPATPFVTPNEATGLHTNQAWYWTYLMNVLVTWRGMDIAPLQSSHLWSLAVEEQFYLVWPLAIAYAATPQRTARLAIAVIVGSALLRVIALTLGANAIAAYTLTPLRGDALAWGALAAAANRDSKLRQYLQRLWRSAIAIGLGTLGVVIARLHAATFPSPSMQMVGYPAVGLLCAGVVACAVTKEPRWMQSTVLTVAGKVSYGFYLWHMVVIALLERTSLTGPRFVIAALITSYAITAFSWFIVEQPALRLKQLVPMRGRPPRRGSFAPAPEQDPS